MTALEDLSREIILDHYQNPRNHGRLDNPTLANRGHNPLCGDEIELSVTIDDDNISDIAFAGRGCSISQASASMMTETVKGHRLDEAEAVVKRSRVAWPIAEPPPAELEEELDALQGVKKYPGPRQMRVAALDHPARDCRSVPPSRATRRDRRQRASIAPTHRRSAILIP